MVSGHIGHLKLFLILHTDCSDFIQYLKFGIHQWRERFQHFGMEIHYKCGGKLVGERMWTPLKTTITELQFADDAALVGSSREEIGRAARALDKVDQNGD